ncbi:MAG: NAD-dependent epimerase/dehydratase family protein [Armatimonadota bacterium]|nr:NAD-dependent epimerase/dehydratase family protein [Armatimonadota bacterium]MDR7512494.1 NAD-dependent epimerase/dehydratase family protein [Armatimonadota bacterium]
MKVFVAGGTGVLGRAALRALAAAGHDVWAAARGLEKAALVRRLGAEPVDVDLYDPDAVRRAVAGCQAVLRLTTKIPPTAERGRPEAWAETNRLRTEGARVLVDAAIAARARVYMHESIVFVYADAGGAWITEDSRTDAEGDPVLEAALAGEGEAARFARGGGRGVVLRFARFYGPDEPSTQETAARVRGGALEVVGNGHHYTSWIYVADAGRAVAAALDAPSGVYNVCDDEPVPLADYLGAVAAALGAPQPRPAPEGPATGADRASRQRSLRVSNARFTAATGWVPFVRSVEDGWRLIAAAARP